MFVIINFRLALSDIIVLDMMESLALDGKLRSCFIGRTGPSTFFGLNYLALNTSVKTTIFTQASKITLSVISFQHLSF